MNIIKSSLSGLAFVLLGEILSTNLVTAQEVLIHDTSIVNIKQSLVDASGANPGVNANFDSDTGTFSVDGLAENFNEITLSPDVVQALDSLQSTASGSNSNGSNIGESITGGSNSGDSGLGENTTGDSSSGGSGGTDSNNGGLPNSISVNDLAKLVQSDLQESVDSLVAAESIEKQPRRFARRRNSDQNCNCLIGSNGERKTLAELQAEVSQKTTQAENFVREIKKLDPDSNIW